MTLKITPYYLVSAQKLQMSLDYIILKTLKITPCYLFAAHEITHAFDEVGIMYNSEGLFQPLYDNDTIEAFNNASDCIRQQYSTFSVAGEYTPYQNTLVIAIDIQN